MLIKTTLLFTSSIKTFVFGTLNGKKSIFTHFRQCQKWVKNEDLGRYGLFEYMPQFDMVTQWEVLDFGKITHIWHCRKWVKMGYFLQFRMMSIIRF